MPSRTVTLWSITLILLMISLIPLTAASAHTHSPQRTEAFETSECTFDSPLPRFFSQGVECGFLTVPQRHADPNGPTLRLAVAIYKSTGANPEPDPLILAQGGPGGSTIDGFNIIVSNNPLRSKRDIILFDQRGTLYSEPNLVCTELIEAIPEILPLESEAADARSEEALAACHQRLVSENINLSVFNSLENAADIEALRVALGYDKINFYGVSYGTLLGLHLIRNHPEHLRSVILDSVVPAQTNFIPLVAQSTERVFTEFFQACANDLACRTTYPDLEERLFALIDQLNEAPVTISLTDSETGQTMEARFSGDDLLGLIYQIFYIPEGHAITPKVVENIAAGDYTFVEQIWPLFIFDRTFSQGMYFSVICAEDADFNPTTIPLTGVRPRFAESAVSDAQELLDVCKLWQVTSLPATVDDPVVSDIPTLLLSGQFDPITPPSFAATAAETLSNGYLYVASNASHGVALSPDACINRLLDRFLDDPTTAPNAGCLAEADPLVFVTDEVLSLETVGQINRLDEGVFNQIGVAALFLLGVLSATVVWPFVFIIRLFRPRDEVYTPIQRWLRWANRSLVLIFALLALIFVVGLTGVLMSTLFTNTSLAVLSAVPAEAAPLFVIPPLLLFLTGGMVVTVGVVWLKGGGSIGGRIYNIFVVGCAIGYVITLTVGGLMTVLL